MKRREFAIGERVLIKSRDFSKRGIVDYEEQELEGEITNKYDLPDDAIYDVFVGEKYDGHGTTYGMTFRRYECNIYRTHEELVKGQIEEINTLIKQRQEQIKFLKGIKEELKNELTV